MDVCVVDCSFFISSFLPDEENKDLDFFEYSVHVPSIFLLECLNVLGVSLKKRRLTKEQYSEYVFSFKDLPFIVDHFSSTQESLQSISRLAQKYDLTSYDASYLELALRLKSPIGTFDKKIIEACKHEKIRVLSL